MKPNHCICQSIHFRPVPAPVVPPGFTVQSWMQYINTYIDMRIKGLIDKMDGGSDQSSIAPIDPTPARPSDDVQDYVRIRDANHPEDIYRVSIEDGQICSIKEN